MVCNRGGFQTRPLYKEYVGALLFEDPLFCREIYTLLIEHCGKPIQHIGEIDIS
jgi:hypothetical protein